MPSVFGTDRYSPVPIAKEGTLSGPRTVTGYEPRFDFDLRRGKVGEKYVSRILNALQKGTVEVKTDYGSNRTGNLFVEFEQKSAKGDWKPSGIATSEAEFWAFPFKEGAIVVRTSHLKQVCRQVLKESPSILRDGEEFPAAVGHRGGNSQSNAARGVKLPVQRLVDSLRNFG